MRRHCTAGPRLLLVLGCVLLPSAACVWSAPPPPGASFGGHAAPPLAAAPGEALPTTAPLPPPVRPESLEAAWAIALQVDQQLHAQYDRSSASASELAAAQAQRLPTLWLDGAYTLRSNEPGLFFESPAPGFPLASAVFPTAQAHELSFQALARAPLYTSGRIAHAVEAASANQDAAALRAEAFAADLKMRVAEDYVNVLRAEADVQVAESNVRSLANHARDVEAFFLCQRKSRNELLAAQVALANARQELLQAQSRLEAVRSAYNRRLGRPLAAPVWLEPLALEPISVEVDAAAARALTQRNELAELSARARVLRRQAESLLAENRPQVELRAGYQFVENRYQSPEGIAAAAVGASWSPFDGGRARHQAEALYRRAGALDRLERDLASQIALEVRQAWLAVQETWQRLEVTRQAIAHAEENLHVAQMRYASGVAVGAEVLDAELLRVQAHRNHQRARFDALLAQLRLRRAAGEL